MVEGTAYRRRSIVTWYAIVLARLAGKGLVVVSVAWFVAGLAVLLFALATGWDVGRDRSVAASVASVVAWGLLVGIAGLMLSGVLYGIGSISWTNSCGAATFAAASPRSTTCDRDTPTRRVPPRT
jgi:hypothetical protein